MNDGVMTKATCERVAREYSRESGYTMLQYPGHLRKENKRWKLLN